jgi:peptidyl-prolyl cis-trans isomerase B (cyclophilin B)
LKWRKEVLSAPLEKTFRSLPGRFKRITFINEIESSCDMLKTISLSLFLFFGLIAGGAVQQVAAFQGGSATRFLTIRDEIRQLERDISKKFASMPVGFPKEQEVQMKEIELSRARIIELRKQLDDSAIESFTADPARNPQARAHVLQMAIAKLEGRGGDRPFDPARTYELTSLLAKHESAGPDVLLIAFQACLAMQDFQRADRLLLKLKEAKVSISEANQTAIEKLKKSWQQEVARREKEQQEDNLPRVQIETELGNMVLELFEDDSPKTVANFIYLAEQGFYDGSAFYDIRPGETARGGCPNGDGTGDPGYRIANESTSSESRRFFAGTIGMHHEGVNTAGCQFFITYQPKPNLDLQYVAFGRIIEGLETLYQLPLTEPRAGKLSAAEPPKIVRMTVVRKRDHAYEPEKITPLPDTSDLLNIGSSADAAKPEAGKPASTIPDVAPPDDGG